MITLRKKMTLIILGFFLFLILLEAGLRLSGFMARSVQERRNRQSLQQKGSCRIMCIGESTTAGQWPPYLEEILNQRHTGIQFSVIDKGIVGTNSVILLAQLASNLDQYQPDMVIAMMGINDRGILYYKDIPEAQTKLFYYCKTYRLIRLLWLHILAKIREEGAFKQAIARNPKNDRAYVELGQLYRTQGKLSQAEELLKQAIALDPKNDHVYVELGQLYQAQGKLSQAEGSLKKAIALNPENSHAYVDLGGFYRAQGKLSQAEDLLRKAIEINPQNDDAHAELGLIYLIQGNLTQAEDVHKKAIALNPQNVDACVKLGWVYRKEGKLSQAENAFKKAIELNPQNVSAYFWLGWVYQKEGKLTQAEDSLKKAIELNPQSGRAYVGLGGFYQTQGKLSQAEDAFKKAIELNPQNDRTYRALSVLYEEMGKSELAEAYAQKAQRLRVGHDNSVINNNYRKLKAILDTRGIRVVCVQYPMRGVEPLKKAFEGNEKKVIFVDNEKVFRDAVRKDGYTTYFVDMFGGDFGHCTAKGNRLLAENIADTILKEVFHDNP